MLALASCKSRHESGLSSRPQGASSAADDSLRQELLDQLRPHAADEDCIAMAKSNQQTAKKPLRDDRRGSGGELHQGAKAPATVALGVDSTCLHSSIAFTDFCIH